MMDISPNIVDAPEGVKWQPLDTVPKNGSVFAVRYHPWDNKNSPLAVQCAWWFGDAIRPPFCTEGLCFAESWAPLQEIALAAWRENQ